jgi:tRNA(fMet)-specific endonuclease VapC
VSAYCFDTDVLSATLWRRPPIELVRALAQVAPEHQSTTSITVGELLYGARKRGSLRLTHQIREVVLAALTVLPFDETAARAYAEVRTDLEQAGQRLDEPALRIAAIALSRDLTLVTGNVRHFERVKGLRVENWIHA